MSLLFSGSAKKCPTHSTSSVRNSNHFGQIFFTSSPQTLVHQMEEKTRMHSSRMSTACFSGHLVGDVCLWSRVEGEGLPADTPLGRHPNPGQTLLCQVYAGIHTFPLNRITDRCKNITIPQLCLRAVNSAELYNSSWGYFFRKKCVTTCIRSLMEVNVFSDVCWQAGGWRATERLTCLFLPSATVVAES